MSIILTLACNHFCDEPILSNNKLKEELGISGRNFVMKKYSWNASVRSLENIYNSLILGTNDDIFIQERIYMPKVDSIV